MNQNLKPTSEHHLLQKNSWWQRLNATDWLFAVVMVVITVFARVKLLHHAPDIYEEVILWCALLGLILLGWFDKPLRLFIPLCALAAYWAVALYAGDFAANESQFMLKYLLFSQAAIMWLCTLTVLAFCCYLGGALLAWKQGQDDNTLIFIAGKLAWAAAFMGMVGLLVRWHESYLLRPDAGHFPVSNLYEVFILFMVIIALMFLYYAAKSRLQRLGVFVYALQCVLVAFVMWYSMARGAQEIQPLIPALQSWWMKIHVPANFIGYGGFCIAAMLAIAQLFAIRKEERAAASGSTAASGFLPPSAAIEEVMYKAIAIGFLFFTIATILGALWAADAWGRYWSWDPKETWALIVWLNYAIWLHMRLVSGWRGKILAWWALVGLLITTFAFVGVNMFLSGLHAYGSL
ncbi:MAG: c-type cytochrome biogenesis protein CcsB [Neisseria sp.]|nr:c-type cytochrome biogenesis protein CcsB [Neisseria sp.]